MFDIGFSELVIIGVVALVVFGPEDLPRVARMAGHLLGRVRRQMAEVRADIDREMQAADFKRLQDEMQGTIQGVQDSFAGEQAAVREVFEQGKEELARDLAPLAEPLRADEPVEPVPAPVAEAAAETAPFIAPEPVALAAEVLPADPVPAEAQGAVIEAPAKPEKPPRKARAVKAAAPEPETLPAEDQLDLFGQPLNPAAARKE